MIQVCGYCRRLRPQHKDDCVYVGAVRYYDVLGGTAPPPTPWVAPRLDADNDPIDVDQADRTVYDKLMRLLPMQHELTVARIVDV